MNTPIITNGIDDYIMVTPLFTIVCNHVRYINVSEYTVRSLQCAVASGLIQSDRIYGVDSNNEMFTFRQDGIINEEPAGMGLNTKLTMELLRTISK